jgi:alpha-glucosidase
MTTKRFFSLLSIQILFFLTSSISQWQSIGTIVNFEKTTGGIDLASTPAVIKISVIQPDIIRIRMSKDGVFAPDSSWAIITRGDHAEQFSVEENTQSIILKTSMLSLEISKSPCRFTFYDAGGNLLNADEPTKGIAWAGSEVAVWKQIQPEELFFGFGEKAGSFQKNGRALTMWNYDIPAYKADTDPLYEAIPFFYGIRRGVGYGIFFDNTYYSFFNMGKEDPRQYSFGATDGELNYYFIYGPKPAEVLAKFSQLIGTSPMPPRWALGYQQCRWSYYPESRVREIASTFRSKNIPCDAIYLDIHYMDGYRCFTWDSTRFPNPKKMTSDLARDGFKIVTIIDPGIKYDSSYWVFDSGMRGDHFVKYPDGKYFTGTVWPGECVFPDFTRDATRTWWGSLYAELLDAGIKGFWNDMNEPSVFDTPNKTFPLNVMHDDRGMRTDHRKNHNIYGMQMVRGTYDGVKDLRPNERPFVLTRANYAGGNRYSAAWTGDNISSWEHLEMAIPMCLNLSLSGQPFVGTDIGGFVGSPNGELYTRWLQFGTFTPLMRTHTELGSKDQEPWSYGPEYEAINRKSIELRYKLLPYLYTQFYTAERRGTPIMRPVFYDFPDDQDLYFTSNEFLFGRDILVAPILWEGATKRDVRLPAGDWYDYWTNEKISGPKYFTTNAPIDRIPIFVRAGAILPTQQVMQYADQTAIDPLTLEIFPSQKSSTLLYEDDGISFDYRNGKYCLRKIEWSSGDAKSELVMDTPEGSYKPEKRNLVVKIFDWKKKPSRVLAGNKVLVMGSTGWETDMTNHTLTIHLTDTFKEQWIRIEY